MLTKKFLKEETFLAIGIIIIFLLELIMIDHYIFFDIFALILGSYLLIEGIHSYKNDNEHPFIIYFKLTVGAWFIGEHLYLIIFGRCL